MRERIYPTPFLECVIGVETKADDKLVDWYGLIKVAVIKAICAGDIMCFQELQRLGDNG